MPTKGSKTQQFFQGVGRRRTATATVRLFDERGALLVNKKPIEEYFPGEGAQEVYLAPLQAVGMLDKFRGEIRTSGGGKQGQLGAVVLGVARALLAYDESLRPTLAKQGLLTRDSRMKERKKVYCRSARRAPQFSKR